MFGVNCIYFFPDSITIQMKLRTTFDKRIKENSFHTILNENHNKYWKFWNQDFYLFLIWHLSNTLSFHSYLHIDYIIIIIIDLNRSILFVHSWMFVWWSVGFFFWFSLVILFVYKTNKMKWKKITSIFGYILIINGSMMWQWKKKKRTFNDLHHNNHYHHQYWHAFNGGKFHFIFTFYFLIV